MRHLQITQAITNRETQSIESYLAEIGKVDLISAEEETVLAQKIRQGDQEALERLTKANLRFVVSVAKKYQHQGLSLGDLISEGNLGLIKAAKRFDETRGFKFISFAVWWIRQCMIAAISENARIIRLPQNKINEISKINKAAAILEQQTLRQPSTLQLAEYLEIAEEKIIDALYVAPWTMSFDKSFGEEDDYGLLDQIPSDYAAADQFVITESSREEINSLLYRLSERERHIIELTYGLTGGLEMCPADISPHIGLSTERVRQITNEAMGKLRSGAAII
jgi:RNA polymerase primary sigma factor